MNTELLHKLIEAIVAEVVRRVAVLERQRQHPERVLVLVGAPVAYPEELQNLLTAQFGQGYTPVCFRSACEWQQEHMLYAEALGEGKLLEMAAQAKTVILVGPRLELLSQIAAGEDRELLSYLIVRSVLWRKDVRLYLDFEPPKFRRNTFLEGVAASLETLREMNVTVCPYYTGDAAEQIGASLVTEADVLAAAQTAERTIRCRLGAIITPAARDALQTVDVTVQYEGESICN